MRSDRFKYDAFVSHAVEDKIAVANELCVRLERAGLRLWYSGKKLKVGDSLEKSIDAALDQSRYGIVILSPTYLGKSWPRKEYYMLKAKEAECGKVILPVLYGITMEELQKSDIHIADRWAIPIDEKGMDIVVQKLLEEIVPSTLQREKRSRSVKGFLKNRIAIGAMILTSIFSCYFAYSTYQKKNTTPPLELVHQSVQQHLNAEDSKIRQMHDVLLDDLGAQPSTLVEIISLFNNYSGLKSNYRNEYELRSLKKVVRSKKNVEKELNLDIASLTPQNEYNLTSSNIFLATKVNKNLTVEARYLLVNTQPITYQVIDENRLENGDYIITVSYKNHIREFFISLLFPSGDSPLKRHQMVIMGLLPTEKYVFHQEENGWMLDRVE